MLARQLIVNSSIHISFVIILRFSQITFYLYLVVLYLPTTVFVLAMFESRSHCLEELTGTRRLSSPEKSIEAALMTTRRLVLTDRTSRRTFRISEGAQIDARHP